MLADTRTFEVFSKRGSNDILVGMTPCSIDGCEKPAKGRGWCHMHHTRWMRHGDTAIKLANSKPPTFDQILATKVPDFGSAGCWEWAGYRDRRNYGVISRSGSTKRAHRFIYESLIGPIPEGLLLRHSCDNPPCVNPAHLTPGTDMENRMDSVAKDRHTRGTRHRAAKLTEDLVFDIRQRYRAGGVTMRELANEFGVTLTPMSQAIRGVTWTHVPQP